MFGDFRIYGFLALLTCGVIYGIFQAPPLVGRGQTAPSQSEQRTRQAVFNEERDYCEAQPQSLDCQCYARISSEVQSGEGIIAPNVQRIDRQVLARMQAKGSC